MHQSIPFKSVSKELLILNIVIAIIYFSWWLNFSHIGNIWLYSLLFLGEIYHVLMALTFWFTVWPQKRDVSALPYKTLNQPLVDIFVPVAGEPIDVVRQTVLAARDLPYSNHTVYILNDGFVAKKPNWQDMEFLAHELGVKCITRKKAGGAKAGNINHALGKTKGDFIVIFDADMVPHYDFLEKTLPYFSDSYMGFVQAPQYYKNHETNSVTAGAWDQQKLFFGPILVGKHRSNSAFICGTNVVIRRKTLMEVGGLVEDNIAEDFLTSLKIHQKGWKSQYLSEVLAQGLAPEDMGSYYKQQYRWARGSLEVLFGQNPLFKPGLSWGQRIQYLSSALYYLNGLIILIDMIMPLVFLFTGIQPVAATTTSFAIYFLPFMFVNLYTLHVASGLDVSLKAFSFSYSLWFMQLTALVSLLLGIKTRFVVTPKKAQQGLFISIIIPHLLYLLVAVIGIGIALSREGMNPSVATNSAWVIFNAMLFMPFISAALNLKDTFTTQSFEVARATRT